jgi:starch-binding outer membrane protein, SusD/RagB family
MRHTPWLRMLMAATAAGVVGCTTDEILEVETPDVLNVDDYNTTAGAAPLRVGVVSDFTLAFDGGVDAFTVVTGNMADELLASDTFDDRLTINARKSVEVNPAMEAPYRNLHRARSGASRAAVILARTAPEPKFNRGEVYMLRGYTEVFFGEMYCSGVPFSDESGGATAFGKPLTTAEMFQAAVASFDTALTLADTSQRVRYGSQIGRARALLNLARFNDAASAVSGVPQSFKLETYHSTASAREENGMWNATTIGSSRYMIMNNEGRNGLPYLQTPPDPRVPWQTSRRAGFNTIFQNLPDQLKFTRTNPGLVGNGIEAQLMVLEARLQGGAQADRDAVYAGLNALRASGPPIVPAMTAGAPTTQAAAVDLLFRERAYWLWLTGHRLGDLRRLVRQYGRSAETVFPTGDLTSPFVGTYGTSVNVTIPFDERNNPNFSGCLDLRA